MIPANKVLMGALALQVGLAVFTWLPDGREGAGLTTLVSVDMADVTQLEIVGRTTPDMESSPDPIVLTREGEGWVLESFGGYPARTDRVEEVLSSLTEVKVRAPIGTTEGAHSALQVADDQFTRKVTLHTGDEATTLYLGAASGASMQVRPDGAEEVYVLRGVTAWSVPDTSRRFFDSSYVSAKLDDVTRLRIRNAQGNHEVIQMGGTWGSEELEDPNAVHQAEVAAIARNLTTVRIAKPIGREVKPEHGLDGSVRVEFNVVEDDQSVSYGYTVGARHEDAMRYVKADHSDWVVAVLESNVIRAIETDFLFLEGEPPDEAAGQPPGGFFGGG